MENATRYNTCTSLYFIYIYIYIYMYMYIYIYIYIYIYLLHYMFANVALSTTQKLITRCPCIFQRVLRRTLPLPLRFTLHLSSCAILDDLQKLSKPLITGEKLRFSFAMFHSPARIHFRSLNTPSSLAKKQFGAKCSSSLQLSTCCTHSFFLACFCSNKAMHSFFVSFSFSSLIRFMMVGFPSL